MIYVLIGVAIFALLVWAGRRARPFLVKRELRIVSGALGAVAVVAGAFAATRGAWLPGAILGAVGLALATTGRLGFVQQERAPPPPADDGELAEARDILGVGPTATREDIQAAYARLIRAVHPDAGGSSGLASRLNAARDVLLRKQGLP